MSELRTPPQEETEIPAESTDKLEAGDIKVNSPVLRWLDNFWYHYKWTVIVVAFFATVLVVCTVQMVSKPSYDTHMVLGSPYLMDNEERADFEKLLSDMCPEDFNGDGKKQVSLTVYHIYSDAEYEAEKESDEHFGINVQYNNDERGRLTNQTMSGEVSVYLLSPSLYVNLRDNHRLKSLAELYPDGNLPAGALADGYGITLGETDFYKYHPAAQVLPANTVLCILIPTLSGRVSDEEAFAHDLAYFHAIADYQVKE